MKVIYNKHIPLGSYVAITLPWAIYARKEYCPLSISAYRHEHIHVKQGKELLWVFFYLIYALEWLFRLIQFRDKKKAYRNISFEREAYSNQNNINYLNTRKAYSWIKYLKEK